MHTIASLKVEHKTLVAAKAAHQVKATSWQTLVNKLNTTSEAKPLSVAELKTFVYQKFSVASTAELRKSKSFAMAIDGLDPLNFTLKSTWESLYRQFIDILPHEKSEQGDSCINGVDIFKYFRPWQVFGLNGKTANKTEIKAAYRNLSKVYHPDVPITGSAVIFDRITTMYNSISAEA
jgi:DnaJ domain